MEHLFWIFPIMCNLNFFISLCQFANILETSDSLMLGKLSRGTGTKRTSIFSLLQDGRCVFLSVRAHACTRLNFRLTYYCIVWHPSIKGHVAPQMFSSHLFLSFVLSDIWPDEKMGALYHPWRLILGCRHYRIKNLMICF